MFEFCEAIEMDGDGRGEWERARRVKSFPTPPMGLLHSGPQTPIRNSVGYAQRFASLERLTGTHVRV